MSEVSVVIVCMNRPDNLYPCLDSLFGGTQCGIEVFVVAYKYDKVSLAGAQNRYPMVRFIVSDEWRGFAENNNLALRQVQTPYTLILNDDTLVPNGLIDTLLADFKAFEQYRPGIIASPLYNEDGTLQFCGRKEFTATKYIKAAWHIGELNPESFDGFETVELPTGPSSETTSASSARQLYKVGNVSGACFMIPTALFRDLGFFDERFFFTPEDIAISVAVRKKGFAVYMDPTLKLIHKYHGSTSRIAHAIRPAEIRGCMIHLCDGKPLKYFAVGLCIWLAEASKLLKALLKRDKISIRIYANTTRSIFTRALPKTLFLKYLVK